MNFSKIPLDSSILHLQISNDSNHFAQLDIILCNEMLELSISLSCHDALNPEAQSGRGAGCVPPL